MFKKYALVATTTIAALLGSTQIAQAQAHPLDNNMVVRDTNGHIVRSIAFGNCVRTKWEAGTDACAPAAPEPVTRAPRTLEHAENVVYFDFDSAQLNAAAKSKLNYMAGELRGAKDVRRADIVGYADPIGANSYNIQLSERRANTVKDYLARQGYLNTRVVDVRGLGETDAFTNCDRNLPRTQRIACLEENRRVEVRIQYLGEPGRLRR